MNLKHISEQTDKPQVYNTRRGSFDVLNFQYTTFRLPGTM